MQRRTLILIVVSTLALGLAACSSSSKTSGTPATSGGTTSGNTITIKNFTFTTATVKAGSTVTVKNDDSTAHTLTSDTAGQFDAGTISPGKSATFTAPSKPGAYPYHCNIHTYMKNTLTVT
ncbi:MAG TPA: cupredoxin domain-containing protein [Mycobacteriales bacterium]|nr:cupredoxin domain-containing protein [Mycobacteriales bacterium]